MKHASAEAARHASFAHIRYAQVWEDADVLLDALDPQPEDTCLSIASAGDNALSLLSRGPARVVAVDLNPSQLACLALRVAAFRMLDHHAVLQLIGARPCPDRWALYQRCRPALEEAARNFWDARPELVGPGIGHAGKFERYFALFRTRLLPLVHGPGRILNLLEPRNKEARHAFYDEHWNTWRWRLLFRLFFSRTVMGRMGRDPSFFRYVDGPVSVRILERVRHALTELAPAENPYLHWILLGRFESALPHYLREENFDPIRRHLDRLEWHECAVEDMLQRFPCRTFSKFNLSDIFEYMSESNTAALLQTIASLARRGARLAYWNMLAPRQAGPELAGQVRTLGNLGMELQARDKAFFYSAFRVEEVAA